MSETPQTRLPDDAAFQEHLSRRQRRGMMGAFLFLCATLVGVVVLIVLLITIINGTFGLVAVEYVVDPATLSDKPLDELNEAELGAILTGNLRKGLVQKLILDHVLGGSIPPEQLTSRNISDLIPNGVYTPAVGERLFTELSLGDMQALLAENVSQGTLLHLVQTEVTKQTVLHNWQLIESLTNRAAIEGVVAQKYPNARLEFHSWLNGEFLSNSMDQVPTESGIRGALVGTLWVMALTMLIALPLGVGAAIYLEEYARQNRLNKFIETNIRNLAGVPSIIYGLLGLAIFARAMQNVTGGRTVLTAALTMMLLILPVIIINAQEAIRAVPNSIREASYGLGATQWQTIWRQILPAALPGIMTGMILSLSRAIGETAPLIVVGAAVFLSLDPSGPLSEFSVMPIQIFNWTKEADPQFRAVASAGIIMLLLLLLSMNAAAIILRNRYSRRLS
jgi:phosphate transport system permease protein